MASDSKTKPRRPVGEQFYPRYLLVRFNLQDIAEEDFVERVLHFAKKRNIDSVLITKQGHVLFSCFSGIRLRRGMETLKKHVQTRFPPWQLDRFRNLPEEFLKQYFYYGYDEVRVRATFGPEFKSSSIKKILAQPSWLAC